MTEGQGFSLTELVLDENKGYSVDNKIGNSAQLAASIYNQDLKNSVGSLVSPDIKAYIFSSDQKDIPGNLKSIVLIDSNNKSVTIVTAGTRIGNTYNDMVADLKDDAKLGLGLQPRKKYAVQQVNLSILALLKDEKSQYDFHYVGHSLGAVVSDIAATDMAMKLAKQDVSLKSKISTATFDNPGSYTLVHKMLKKYKDNLMKKEDDLHKVKMTFRAVDETLVKEENARHKSAKKQINSLKLEDFVDYKSFNNRENFINTNDKQAGKHYTIVPEDQKERGAFSRMLGWLAEKMPGFVIKKILKLMSYGSLSGQAADHNTDHFIKVLQEENGKILYSDGDKKIEISILDFTHNTKPLEYNETIFAKLTNKDVLDLSLQDHSKDVANPEFSMYNQNTNTRLEFSRDDLVGVLGAVDKNTIEQDVIKNLAMHLKMDKGYARMPSKTKDQEATRQK